MPRRFAAPLADAAANLLPLLFPMVAADAPRRLLRERRPNRLAAEVAPPRAGDCL